MPSRGRAAGTLHEANRMSVPTRQRASIEHRGTDHGGRNLTVMARETRAGSVHVVIGMSAPQNTAGLHRAARHQRQRPQARHDGKRGKGGRH